MCVKWIHLVQEKSNMDSCERGNEPFCFIKDGQFTD